MPDKKKDWNNSITDSAPCEESAVRQLYDDFSSQYNSAVSQWGYTAPEVAAKYLRHTVPARQAVLDAGCGTGLAGLALADQGYPDITGTDLSAESLELAKATGCYQQVHIGNLNNSLPYSSGQFGGVVCVGVLSYMPNPEPALRELLRVLSPGGTLVFTQREDHYIKYQNADLFNRLQKSERFEQLVQTDPESYLPENPSFANTIGVHYFVWRKGS